MVWAGISIQGRIDLRVVDGGAVNAQRYSDEIKRSIVRPYVGPIGKNFNLCMTMPIHKVTGPECH